MKKIILLTLAVFFTGIIVTVAQTYVVNPIPSYNFPMNEPEAVFHENKKLVTTNKEKRDMDVVVNTRSTSWIPVLAHVWVFKRTSNIIKGPYHVYPGIKLEVAIDNGKWGVLVKCDESVDVSVWTDD
jgi:hypothetical protein